MKWTSLIASGHSIQMQMNTLSSQVHMEHSQDRPHLGHKSNLRKFKKIETISSIFSDRNTIRLDINYKKKKKKLLETQMEIKQHVSK